MENVYIHILLLIVFAVIYETSSAPFFIRSNPVDKQQEAEHISHIKRSDTLEENATTETPTIYKEIINNIHEKISAKLSSVIPFIFQSNSNKNNKVDEDELSLDFNENDDFENNSTTVMPPLFKFPVFKKVDVTPESVGYFFLELIGSFVGLAWGGYSQIAASFNNQLNTTTN